MAWGDLPLGPVMLSEIEAYPRAVLAHRHGARCMRLAGATLGVPLWGDFTAIRVRFLLRLGVDLESVEILVGGTPCQDFSMAGLRRGIGGDRGNLSLEFIRLANAIDNFRRARGLAPLIILWENVDGVLSMPDNAFGCFLAGLAGGDSALVPPGRGRWTDAGLVTGPARTVAWRLFDAQYFGLAQRRRRVFVVASARAGCCAQILFESEGVRRDSPPRRQARESVAGTVAGGARRRGGYSHDDIPIAPALSVGGRGTGDFELAGGLTASTGGADENDAKDGRLVAFGSNNTSGALSVASALLAKGGASRMDFETETFVAHTLRAEGFDASEDGSGRGTPLVPVMAPADVAATLNASHSRLQGVSGQDANHGHSYLVPTAFRVTGNDGAYELGETAGAVNTMTDPSAQVLLEPVAVSIRGREGGGTAEIAEDGDISPAMRASQGGGDKPHALTGVGVRRLTPRECERLQGFPDDYTLIPYRGGMAADGPRYKALGNSMPVPVMRWLGERISHYLG